MITLMDQEATEIQYRIRCAWSAFPKHRQELTAQSHLLTPITLLRGNMGYKKRTRKNAPQYPAQHAPTHHPDKRNIQKHNFTARQEDDVEDWIEYVQRSTKEADEKMLTCNITNWVETEKLKRRQALRMATQSHDRWTREAAEWNPGLFISTKTQKKEEQHQPKDGKTT